jgi:hypothetical protein
MRRAGRGRYETEFGDAEFTERPDGSRVALFALGDGPTDPVAFALELGPNYTFPWHYHRSHYISVIVKGSIRVGTRWYHAGAMRLQERGSVYGPEQAGPEGCWMVNIFADRRGFHASMLDVDGSQVLEHAPHLTLRRSWNALADEDPGEFHDGQAS